MRFLPGCRWRESHAQSVDGERSIEDRTHGPADDPPAAEVQNGDQIQPALAGQEAGRIGDPDLVRTLDHETWERIGCDRSAMAAVGGGVAILGALPRQEAFGTHEPGDAVTPSWAAEHAGESRAAISLATAGEFLPDAGPQVDRLGLPRPRLSPSLFPVVIAAARDQEGLA